MVLEQPHNTEYYDIAKYLLENNGNPDIVSTTSSLILAISDNLMLLRLWLKLLQKKLKIRKFI